MKRKQKIKNIKEKTKNQETQNRVEYKQRKQRTKSKNFENG